MIAIGERAKEKGLKLRDTVFTLDDDSFNQSLNTVPPVKRQAIKTVRNFVGRIIEEQGLVYLDCGVECAVFLQPKDGKVKKYFWAFDARAKYDRLCRDEETIRDLVGDVAVDTETTTETFSIFKLGRLTVPVQVQELVPQNRLPDNPEEAGIDVLTDLELLLMSSKKLRDTKNPWIDVAPRNFSVGDRISFFDLSLFDPTSRGQVDTTTSLSLHSEFERYLASAKTHA